MGWLWRAPPDDIARLAKEDRTSQLGLMFYNKGDMRTYE